MLFGRKGESMTSHDDRSTAQGETVAPVASANGNKDLQLQKDILWSLFEEHRAHARHTETLRSTVVGMLILASTALVTLATYDKKLNSWDIPPALLLITFGILGFLFGIYHTEKIVSHKAKAIEYGKELDKTILMPLTGAQLIEDIDDRTRKKLSKPTENPEADTYKTYVNRLVRYVVDTSEDVEIRPSLLLWSMLPALIAVIGLILLVEAIPG